MGNLKLASFHLTSKHGKLHANALGFEFNGKDDFIDLPSHWGGPNWKTLTVEAWINPSANTGDFQAILSPKDTSFIHFQLHNKGVGNIAIYTDQGSVMLPVIPVEPLNQWRHVAVVVESGNSNLLIDGQQYGETNTKEFNYILPTDDLNIGRGYQGGRHFKGKIGNVHIWHDVRPHEHIHGDLYRFMADKPEIQTSTPVATIFGFKSYHGKYMSAQPNGTMECNRDHLRGWEKFTVEDAGNGTVGLKSYHGKYLSAQPDGRLECNRDHLRGWEKFTLEENGGKVGLKGFHGKYISAQPDGTITCDRDWLRGWEKFTKEPA
jgi:hypothetical protein